VKSSNAQNPLHTLMTFPGG